MKKTISGVLLALTAVFALVACGKKKTKDNGTTDKGGSKTEKKEIISNGKVINFYCWNNEFQSRLRKYYPGYGKNLSAQADIMKDGTTIMWTMVANANGSYQTALDEALKSDSVDMYCFEADYAKKYVESKYVVDMSTLGIDQKGQYQYTVDAVTNKAGKVVGSSWQGCPGCICFNETIAKDVYSDYSIAKMDEYIAKDKETFVKQGATLKAKGYALMIGNADWYRVYGNNISGKMFDGDKTITVDKNIFQYAADTKAVADAEYLLGADSTYALWSNGWKAGMKADTKAFTVFACPWFTDFSLKENCPADAQGASPWRVSKGYASWFWGGTWLTATPAGIEDAVKKATITSIIKDMTTNATVLRNLSDGELDFTNNKEAMDAKAADTTVTNAYFGGQNTYAIYAKSVLNASLANASDYDQQITENFQSCFLPYIQGAATGGTASACWTEFVKKMQAVKEDFVVNAATGVTCGDTIEGVTPVAIA